MPTLAVDRSRYEPKEIVMNPIRHIRRIACVLAGLAAGLLACSTAPAFAMEVPASGGGGPAVAPPHLAPVHTVVAGGMPGWQIALIAIGTALFAAAAAVLLDRARTARRRSATAAA
jgi:hypothetical protein